MVILGALMILPVFGLVGLCGVGRAVGSFQRQYVAPGAPVDMTVHRDAFDNGEIFDPSMITVFVLIVFTGAIGASIVVFFGSVLLSLQTRTMSIPRERATKRTISIRMVMMGFAMMMLPVLIVLGASAARYILSRSGMWGGPVDAFGYPVDNPDDWNFEYLWMGQLLVLCGGLGSGFVAFFGSALLFLRPRLESSIAVPSGHDVTK